MNCGVAAAVESVGIVLLLAVIGQGLSRDLAAGDAAAVGEGGDEQRVDGALRLQDVEHRLDALVDEGDGADLNTDHAVFVCRLRGSLAGCGEQPGRSGQEVTSCCFRQWGPPRLGSAQE